MPKNSPEELRKSGKSLVNNKFLTKKLKTQVQLFVRKVRPCIDRPQCLLYIVELNKVEKLQMNEMQMKYEEERIKREEELEIMRRKIQFK